MFGTLFLKECKQVAKSLVYYIYVIVLIFFITSQMGEDFEILSKPEVGMESYGVKETEDKGNIMRCGVRELLCETSNNCYLTYPVGFAKQVVLNEEELSIIKGYLEDMTGKSYQALEAEMIECYMRASEAYDDAGQEGYMEVFYAYTTEIREDLTYEEFLNIMEKVRKIVGSGSSYEQSTLEEMAYEAMSYEEALEAYNDVLEKDHISGAYARLFCDYASMILAILPAFLGVTRCLRDKRSKVSGVIYAKKVSTTTLLLSRYLANVVMIFLPVVVLAFFVQMPYLYHAQTLHIAPDYFIFLRYVTIWLLPLIMAVVGLSFFLTEVLDSIVPIFVQIAWAGASLFSADTLVGNFGLKLMPRWNTVGETALFFEQIKDLYCNRSFYVLLSLVFVAGAILAMTYKRKKGVNLIGKVC